jgi:hypothetical protein
MASSKWFFVIVGTLGLSVLTGCGAIFINEGSKEYSRVDGLQNPDENKPKLTIPPEQCVISDFQNSSTNVNAKLFGASGGTWIAFSFGGNVVNNPFLVEGGANGDKMAAHIFGTLTDKGDSSYPAFTLQCQFNQSGLYDASNFNGIKFYYKCPSKDQALKRRFCLGTAPTLPASAGGNCSSNCFDHFGAVLNPSEDWVAYNLKFTDLSREGWGAPVTPPDLVDHLKEFINLTWNNSANNTAGSYGIDFWVDDVEFF